MSRSIAAIVPMRHDSERVPGKNYRVLGDRPLFHHIIGTLLQVPAISTVIIDTDSELIRDQASEAFPTVRVIDRPVHLRGGMVPMNDVLLHDISEVPADLYLQTHSTNPLLRPATVAAAIDRLLSAPDADSLFGVTRLQTRLWTEDGRPLNHDPSVLLRTQDLPPVFEENSCIYLFTADGLERRGNRIGERPILFEIDRDEASDIDEEVDFQIAEALYALRQRERG